MIPSKELKRQGEGPHLVGMVKGVRPGPEHKIPIRPSPSNQVAPEAPSAAKLGSSTGLNHFDCSHKFKRHLLLGRKAMTNLDSLLKHRDVTFLTKVHKVKAMAFSIVMYRCESWAIKKTELQRTDAFELWCWRKLLRIPWTARSNQSILMEINPEYSLEGLMLMLKLQYFDHLV